MRFWKKKNKSAATSSAETSMLAQPTAYLEGMVSDYAPPCIWAQLQSELSQPGNPGRAAVKRKLYEELDRAWLMGQVVRAPGV